ncbi:MAG: hypothetical protein ACKOCM_11715 [Cyanobacteriota bacterium]
MDRPQSPDQAQEFPSTPEALSHRQLLEWFRQAPREADQQEVAIGPLPTIGPLPDRVSRLEGLLEQHEGLSQAILEELSSQGEFLQSRYSPPQLMALGALAAHLQLSLQALAASRR